MTKSTYNMSKTSKRMLSLMKCDMKRYVFKEMCIEAEKSEAQARTQKIKVKEEQESS